MIYLLLWFAILTISVSEDAPCADDPTFFKANNPKKNCEWLGEKEERRYEKCGKFEYRDACPVTCGICCEDDDTWKFYNNLGVEKSCKWLAGKAKRIAKYCDTQVMEICKKSCNNCLPGVPTVTPTNPRPTISPMPSKEPPTSTPSNDPSASPTKSPSDVPSTSPSVSTMPSKSPSDRPTQVPSASPTERPTRNPSESPSGHPSSEPTVSTPKPTKSPKPTRSPRPSRQPSEAPTATCMDSLTEKFRANVGTEKGCQWLAKKVERIVRYCGTTEVRQICPVTCNSC